MLTNNDFIGSVVGTNWDFPAARTPRKHFTIHIFSAIEKVKARNYQTKAFRDCYRTTKHSHDYLFYRNYSLWIGYMILRLS